VTDEPTTNDELASLKLRAKLMNIPFSNNISVETLREKVRAAMDGAKPAADNEPSENPLDLGSKGKAQNLRQRLIDEQTRLIRIRVTCMNPNKKDLKGEFFTVANDYIGTIRKFVPFGEATEEGYHVPYCIYRFLESRRFVNITTSKDRRTGLPVVKSQDAKEFAIEVLKPLTPEEIKTLATAQIAAGTFQD